MRLKRASSNAFKIDGLLASIFVNRHVARCIEGWQVIDGIDDHNDGAAESGIITGRRKIIVQAGVLDGYRDRRCAALIRNWRKCERAGWVRTGVGNRRIRDQGGVIAGGCHPERLRLKRAGSNAFKIDVLLGSVFVNGEIIDCIEGWRVVYRVD